MKEWTREERYRELHDAEEVRGLYEQISKSAYRQKYHIQPVTGLSSDPNGFALHKGVWHLCYQWCPWGAVHGLKYWYHVTSEDLIHWRNAGIRKSRNTWSTSKFGLGVQNEAGQRLTEFCQENTLVIANTLFLPTKQEKTLHTDITKWSIPKADQLYFLQPKMEKLYTVSNNKTGS